MKHIFALLVNGEFRSFYPHPCAMTGCNGDLCRVKLTIDDAGDYYSWMDHGRNNLLFTNKNINGVEICFPYGSKAEEELDRGHIVKVKVDLLENYGLNTGIDKDKMDAILDFMRDN